MPRLLASLDGCAVALCVMRTILDEGGAGTAKDAKSGRTARRTCVAPCVPVRYRRTHARDTKTRRTKRPRSCCYAYRSTPWSCPSLMRKILSSETTRVPPERSVGDGLWPGGGREGDTVGPLYIARAAGYVRNRLSIGARRGREQGPRAAESAEDVRQSEQGSLALAERGP
ncbi:hypothetical protein FB451DRAFT_1373050 [Mycena latifolia]|nr:hypothetical protein FB451DRAFT_1373050 [Mycena latifolia]